MAPVPPAPSFRIDVAAARTLTGGIEPAETVADQIARRPGILARTDSLVASTVHGDSDGSARPAFTIAATCSGTSCALTESTAGISQTVRLGDLEVASPGSRAVLSRNGATLLEYAGANLRAYSSWLEHSAFGVIRESGTTNGVGWTLLYGVAGGDLTGSRPSVDATWTGVMVGTPATGAGRGDYLQGDASLTFTTSDGLSAHFSNIVNLDTGAAHSVTTATFDEVPVAVDGTFAKGTGGNRIQGGLYGPDHAEAAGVFEQNDIVGAFGARKQP